jgi:pyruvate formate lyase activating enzyme
MCNAKLATVLENLKIVRRSGTHFELVNLVLPTQNDDPGQVEKMCAWIRDNLGADTPLHFSRFHPTQNFRELPATPIKTLERCYDIAQKAGLSFVSLGNVPGHRANSTYCPDCGKRLIHREHFAVLENRVKEAGSSAPAPTDSAILCLF